MRSRQEEFLRVAPRASSFLNKASIVAEGEVENNAGSAPNPWKLCSVTRVEEVKMIIRLLPIWATTIVFWTTQAQMITFAVEQASTMDRRIGNFQIPAASLTAFFVAAIMITLAVNDCLIMPLWKQWKGKPGFTNLQKIAIGLVLSIFGMVAAALCERKRLSVVKAVSGTTSTLPISVFYLIPQYFLVGSGEGFIYTGQLDYFITGSPKGMKTMSTGLFFTTLALGYFGSSFLVSVVKKVTGSKNGQGWLVGNINYGRLDYFYALLAVLGAINFIMYLVCAAWCRPTKAKSASIVNGSGAE
ncbi:protein nrt1/ ptr family 6.2 [Quercus suber]|uniref:Protein nrt1/ ptr family 6.2 n=1 Tax=Quercus suber TaxID=58331 RepID=A0AAW0KXX1_QUESU